MLHEKSSLSTYTAAPCLATTSLTVKPWRTRFTPPVTMSPGEWTRTSPPEAGDGGAGAVRSDAPATHPSAHVRSSVPNCVEHVYGASMYLFDPDCPS